MKPIDSIKDLRAALKQVDSGWSRDTIFGAKALLFIAEQLDHLKAAQPKTRKPRKPSEWNLFFSKGMKAGKPPRQIAEEWKVKRSQPKKAQVQS